MNPRLIGVFVAVIAVLMFGGRFILTVPAGHVAVATLFGEVRPTPKLEGFHVVNPLLSWVQYDARQKTHKEVAAVPTQDQLQTKVDVSVQYRLVGTMAPQILKDTGTMDQAINVHLVPKLRSLLREQGKSIPRAEDFFREETQENLQTSLESELKVYLEPKGIEVQAVLIRDINLPPFIAKAIEAKKEREQEVEKQKAELERFRTEQQQKIAAAEAERQAAEEEAKKRRILADARAYEIEQINKAVARNPAYIQLQSLEALKSMSKDPASKIYFMDSSSSKPLPLMHLGDDIRGR
ncbi:MAG: prohibitin family protein [Proteobacteria bacterium]|nr:prohibitin family protein [Pseudomonadota bacterium]